MQSPFKIKLPIVRLGDDKNRFLIQSLVTFLCNSLANRDYDTFKLVEYVLEKQVKNKDIGEYSKPTVIDTYSTSN